MRTHIYFDIDNHFYRFVPTNRIKVKRIKKVTIQDVARYASVSVGTIDRVIHNRGKVSREKKEKVEDTIKKLNFNPNMLARTLALGNQFAICALVPTAPYPGHYWTMPLQGLELNFTLTSCSITDIWLLFLYFCIN